MVFLGGPSVSPSGDVNGDGPCGVLSWFQYEHIGVVIRVADRVYIFLSVGWLMFILIVRSRPGACVVCCPAWSSLFSPPPWRAKGGTQNNDKFRKHREKHRIARVRSRPFLAEECEHTGCTKRPSYGFASEKKKCCFRHARDGMVNLQRKDCSAPGCKLTANYGFEKTKMYCRAHTEDGMRDPRGVVVGPSTEAARLVEHSGMPRAEASPAAGVVVGAAAAAYATGRSCDGGSFGGQEQGPVAELPASTSEGEGGEEGVAHRGSMGEQEPGPVAKLPTSPSGRTSEGEGRGEEVALAAAAVEQGGGDSGTATVGDAGVETGRSNPLDLLAIACDGARRVDVATPVADATESLPIARRKGRRKAAERTDGRTSGRKAPRPVTREEAEEIEEKADERAYQRSLKTMEHFAALQREQTAEEERQEVHREANQPRVRRTADQKQVDELAESLWTDMPIFVLDGEVELDALVVTEGLVSGSIRERATAAVSDRIRGAGAELTPTFTDGRIPSFRVV
ncbi:unnamed protein product [Ectocarpus sp. 6 AP-2014]